MDTFEGTFDAMVLPEYRYPHSAPNAPVILYQGPIKLHSGRTVEGSGTLQLRWMPSTGIQLEARVLSGDGPEPGETVKVTLGDVQADALVHSIDLASNEIEAFVSVASRGSGDELTSVDFQIVNFVDFITPTFRIPLPHGFTTQGVELLTSDWRILIVVAETSNNTFKNLALSGGYAFTHVGRLERVDKKTFSAADADIVLDSVSALLSFARGAACSSPIRCGLDSDGQAVWERWSSPIVDPWRGRDTWFDEHHGHVLGELFPQFLRLYTDPNLRDPLKLALHWFQKSNTRAGGMEGAIILGLTALELLGALVVVDITGRLTPAKYDRLSAAAKLSNLLAALNISAAFPDRVQDLAAFADVQRWPDAATALAEIRHGYVHSNPRRRATVLSASNRATFGAWQLSLWYQELALLRLLNFRGEYRNRMTAEWVGQVERVPWA